MTEREYILAGNWQLLDSLYAKLRDAEGTAYTRYQFIQKQQHEINALTKKLNIAKRALTNLSQCSFEAYETKQYAKETLEEV